MGRGHNRRNNERNNRHSSGKRMKWQGEHSRSAHDDSVKYKNISVYWHVGWKLENTSTNGEQLKKYIIRTMTNWDGNGSFEEFKKRREIVKAMENVEKKTVKLTSRLAVGMGYSHAIDIPGISLMRNYGIPYIPGSEVKGILADAFRLKYGDKRWGDYLLIFGDVGRMEEIDENFRIRGTVVFFDAIVLPIEEKNEKKQFFDADVMTPHYRKYYSGEHRMPLDVENPVPIPFITVRDGTSIEFLWMVIADRLKERIAIIEKEGHEVVLKNPESINKEIEALIEFVSKDLGWGAKRRVGYGRGEPV